VLLEHLLQNLIANAIQYHRPWPIPVELSRYVALDSNPSCECAPRTLECGKVETGEESWQTLIEYLKANSQFLSHRYCPDCYAQIVARGT
jgi:hypothetical protein